MPRTKSNKLMLYFLLSLFLTTINKHVINNNTKIRLNDQHFMTF